MMVPVTRRPSRPRGRAWSGLAGRSARTDPTARRCCSDALDAGRARADLPRADQVTVGPGPALRGRRRPARRGGRRGRLPRPQQPQAERGAEPVDHFCRRGWRALRNPSLDFDVWWYWAEYLDPTDESETATNPLVHYLLDGRHRGLLPLPPPAAAARDSRARAAAAGPACSRRTTRTGWSTTTSSATSRAGPARRRLRLYDGELRPGQLDRLVRRSTGAWVRAHGAHDFGSWGLLARDLVGWAALEEYDEVLLVNDSCWLLRPLDEVFAAMARGPGDFWGLQLTARRFEPEPSQPQTVPLEEVKRSWLPPTAFRYPELVHVGSYFLALRRPALDDAGFRRRLDAVRPQRDRANLVQKYETGTTQYLVGQGFDFATWVPDAAAQPPGLRPRRLRPAGRGVPAVQAAVPGRQPLRHPGPGRLEGPRARRRARRAGRLFEGNLLRVADPDGWRAPSRSGPVVTTVRSRQAAAAASVGATSTRRAARAAKECSVRTRSAAARRAASSPKTASGSGSVARRRRSSTSA